MAHSVLPFYTGQQFTNAGVPLIGGKLAVYLAGTWTPATVYIGLDGGEGENPVILDEAGRLPHLIWVDVASVDIQLLNSSDEVLEYRSNLPAMVSAGGSSGSDAVPNWKNVLAYGAAGDGDTDDTDAFRSAMEAASGDQTLVYVPAGTYKVTNVLNNSGPRANCAGFVGDSLESSRIDGSDITGDFSSNDVIRFAGNGNGLTFRDFTVVSGPSHDPAATGLSLATTGEQVSVTNVRAEDCATGFFTQTPQGVTYTNCYAENFGDVGFDVFPAGEGWDGGEALQYNSCVAEGGSQGFRLTQCRDAVVSACLADGCHVGYDLVGTLGCSVVGSASRNNTNEGEEPGYGVRINSGSGNTVTSLWTHNLPGASSLMVRLEAGASYNTVTSASGLQQNGHEPTAGALVDGAECIGNVFVGCAPYLDNDGYQAADFVVADTGTKTLIVGNGSVGPISGGLTISSGGLNVTGGIDMNNSKVTELATPTASTDAATKAYVDSAVATVAQVMTCYHSTTSTTGGNGTLTWTVRPLNLVSVNTITGASLASNTITLPAGTYRVDAFTVFFENDDHKSRLRNTTDGTTLLLSSAGWLRGGDGRNNVPFHITGVITLAATKDLQIQSIDGDTGTAWGQTLTSFGSENNVWVGITIQKLA